VLATTPFPEAAEEYRSRLLDALRAAWTDYAPLVDEIAQP